MPSSPRGVQRLSGQEKRARPYRRLPGRCGHRPLQNNMRLQRRGRCPHRPVGYVDRAFRENGHACTVGIRSDVGIGHYEKTCVFSVGGDALIVPWGTTPERSEKTDTPVPSASGPMWASAPTKNNVRFQRRGRCPHRPAGCVSRAVRKNGHARTVGFRADVGMATEKQ